MNARYFPLLGLILFLTTIAARIALQLLRYGSSGVILFRSGQPRQRTRDVLVIVLFFAIAGQLLLLTLRPAALAGLTIPGISAIPWVMWLGGALALIGTILMVAAQLMLGASWRIGIEESARPGLVTHGLYRFCRNPIFLFFLFVLTGLTLLVPTWISLAILAAAFYGIRAQVREEEAWLMRAYGDDFLAYARRVGRFLPFVGRLS